MNFNAEERENYERPTGHACYASRWCNFVNWRRQMQDWHVVDEFYLLAIILLSCVRNK